MKTDLLDKAALFAGIGPYFHDKKGRVRETAKETKELLLGAMGWPVHDHDALTAFLEGAAALPWLRILDPVSVVVLDEKRKKHQPIVIRLPLAAGEKTFFWRLLEEGGAVHEGTFRPADLVVAERKQIKGRDYVQCLFSPAVPLETGYHHFEIREEGDGPAEDMRLIVAPASFYVPPGLSGDQRVFGIRTQLHSIRSRTNWGIGDLDDLMGLIDLAADFGGGIVSVGSLNLLSSFHREGLNPFRYSSLQFLNPPCLAIESIPECIESEELRGEIHAPGFQARLAELRDAPFVREGDVFDLKQEVLEKLFASFRRNHPRQDTDRGKAFRNYQRGDAVRFKYALFEALNEHFSKKGDITGWRGWPAPFQEHGSEEVARFALEHPERLEFYQYLQWLAEEQLARAGSHSMSRGLKVGLCLDLPMGAHSDGFDCWLHKDHFAFGARLAAPPDFLFPDGCDYEVIPALPEKLSATAYERIIAACGANMRHAGALRIDSLPALLHPFWRAEGKEPASGAYIQFPWLDIVRILALESQRNRCMVIGGDMDELPRNMAETLAAASLFGHKALLAARDENNHFLSPKGYPRQSLATVTTPRMPTVAGFWEGRDLALLEELRLFPDGTTRDACIIGRAEDRARLLLALDRAGELPAGLSVDPAGAPRMTFDLDLAVHSFLAGGNAKILLFTPRDVLLETEQDAFPREGTPYSNYRLKLGADIESFRSSDHFRGMTAMLERKMGRGTVRPELLMRWQMAGGQAARSPFSFYRLQMHRDFGFAHAAALVPYLKRLGITHCYCSPFLKARPGSLHGYDIIDHRSLNPEIGSMEEFDRFTETLGQHGMGLILDMVPNHMGIGSDNGWWLDVLENGQSSPYAAFFDIDWMPLKDELRGKVLLPILGDHYGDVLKQGLLQLVFPRESGEFFLCFYEHRFPLDPKSYSSILGHDLARLEGRMGRDSTAFMEYQSLAGAFANLPPHWTRDRDTIEIRRRDMEVYKRRLASLCSEHADLPQFIEENVILHNNVRQSPEMAALLHNLLERQPYRLAYWRVAADDINYRRFFDINDLAALRMENSEVFRETHQFVLDLIGAGKIDGLRIDHPDGLHDPLAYCRRLQEEVRKHDLFRDLGDGRKNTKGANAAPLFVVVEKILAAHEHLPEDWPVHGTTGYEFANLVGGLFVDQSSKRKMTSFYHRFVGKAVDFEQLLHDAKLLIMKDALASELNVLATRLGRIAESDWHTRDYTVNKLRDALAEVVAFFPVYRTYVSADRVSAHDHEYIAVAVAAAKKRSRLADTSIYDFLHRVLTLEATVDKDDDAGRAILDFAMSFQQFTGPVMAKGLEDTALYTYNVLLSLNDVGGHPNRYGTSVEAFHHANIERFRRWPQTMITKSTHDSKRSGDARARISVLSEMAAAWRERVTRWHHMNRPGKRNVLGQPFPSKNDEYAIYQTLVGVWPLGEVDEEGLAAFRERVVAYMIKAVREGKAHSSWIAPNEEYEEATSDFVAYLLRSLDNNSFLADFIAFQKNVAWFGMLNGLSQLLLKLTAPGSPDIYQGCELWTFNLVDPDNRRLVDFAERERLLAAVEKETESRGDLGAYLRALLEGYADSRVKLYLSWKALRLRNEQGRLFLRGDYHPLTLFGEKKEHVCAFARTHRDGVVIVAAPRLYARLMEGRPDFPLGEAIWGDTGMEMPDGLLGGSWRNVLTGQSFVEEEHGGRPCLMAKNIFAHFPVALLVARDREKSRG